MTQVLISDRYTSLCGLSKFRYLMSLLKQDMASEKIFMEESGERVYFVVKSEGLDAYQNTRREIIGFLNAIFFSDMETFTAAWWWEMRTRILKVLTIAAVLERENFVSMGGTPKPTSIPQAIIMIYKHIQKLNQSGVFKQLAVEYTDIVKSEVVLPVATLYLKGSAHAE